MDLSRPPGRCPRGGGRVSFRPVTPARPPTRTLHAFLGLAAALLAGCEANPYPGQPDEGTLHVPVIQEMKGFDPIHADEEISNLCVSNVYDQLYEYDYLKRPFALAPCLAQALPELSDGGRTVTIRLRPGVRWQDDPCFSASGGRGREVVASDVIFCIKRLMDAQQESPGTWTLEGRIVGLDAFHEASKREGLAERKHRGAYGADEGYPEVEGLSAPDPHTLVLRLVEPYGELPWVLAMAYLSVYPPEAVAAYGAGFREHPVTCGPYLLASYDRAQQMVLVRNPGYRDDRYPAPATPADELHGRAALAGRRLPLNDRVIATVFKEQQPMWLYFDSGYLDRTGIPKDNFSTAVDEVTGELRGRQRSHGVVLERDPRLEVIYDCFNFDDPVLGRKAGERGRALRRAMSLATDLVWARKHLYNDRVALVQGPIIEEFPEYDPAFVNPWTRRPDETMEQARQRARDLLAAAGMPGGRGVPPIQVDVSDDSTDEQFFVAFQDDMAQLGLRLEPYRVSWQEQIGRQRDGRFQMTGLAWGADYPAAQNFLQLFYGPNRSPGPNSSNYANPEFDALYERALPLPEGPERTDLYRRMQRLVVDDAVWIFRYRREQWSLRHRWLTGWRYNDISLKSFKYGLVDVAARRAALGEWNRVRWAPALIALTAVGLVVGLTLRAARRQTKGW